MCQSSSMADMHPQESMPHHTGGLLRTHGTNVEEELEGIQPADLVCATSRCPCDLSPSQSHLTSIEGRENMDLETRDLSVNPGQGHPRCCSGVPAPSN